MKNNKRFKLRLANYREPKLRHKEKKVAKQANTSKVTTLTVVKEGAAKDTSGSLLAALNKAREDRLRPPPPPKEYKPVENWNDRPKERIVYYTDDSIPTCVSELAAFKALEKWINCNYSALGVALEALSNRDRFREMVAFWRTKGKPDVDDIAGTAQANRCAEFLKQ